MTAPEGRSPGQQFPYSHEVQVSLRDLDAFSHVNHAVYLSYMEVARTNYYFQRRGFSEISELDFILGSVNCRYRSPARLHEVLVVRLGPVRIGTKSWDLAYEVREKTLGRLILEAQTTQVQYDYAALRAVQIPSAVRALLERDRLPR